MITELLILSALNCGNNKLKWNAAVALMGTKGNRIHFDRIKEVWIEEMRQFGNFKVILSFTKLILKWSNDCDEEQPIHLESIVKEIIWEFLNKLKLFLSTEFAVVSEFENVQNVGIKLGEILKSILIGGNYGLNW